MRSIEIAARTTMCLMLSLFLAYLIGSFAAGDWDPSRWPANPRWTLILLALIAGFSVSFLPHRPRR